MNIRARYLPALAIAWLAACGPATTGRPGAAAAAAGASGVTVCSGDGFRLVRARSGGWFSRTVYDGRLEKLRRRASGTGMPEQAIQAALPEIEKKTMGMERHMLDTERSHAYAQLGLVFADDVAIDVAAGAFIVKLRGADGDSLVAPDAGILAPTGPGRDFRHLDTRNGGAHLTRDLQPHDDDKAPFVMFVRLPPEARGMTIESITVDPQRFIVRAE